MDGDIIKKILKNDSEKLIMVENGKPRFVVMSYAQYVKLTEKNNSDENFDMNFEELFPKSGSVKENAEIENDEKLVKEFRVEQVSSTSLDDLPII